MTRGNVLEPSRRARPSGWRVMLGGPEPSNYAEEYLGAGADIIVAGEGEIALEQLMALDFDRASGFDTRAYSSQASTATSCVPVPRR